MRFLFTISFSFFTLFASAQINADTLKLTKGTPIYKKTNGKIKKVRNGYIDLFPKGKFDRKIRYTIVQSKYLLRYRIHKLKYDRKGNNIKSNYCSKEGRFKSKWNYKCKYDKNNNLIKVTHKSLHGEDYVEILLSKTVKNDTLIYKYKNLTKDSIYAYYNIFNDKFHIVEAGNFQSSDRTYFHYDSLGYLIKTENYQDDTLSSIEKYSYRFDENNNLTYRSYYTNSIQEYSEEQEIKIDGNQVITKEIIKRTIDGETEIYEYQDILDRRGNVKKSRNLKTGEISKRRVRYYWFRN